MNENIRNHVDGLTHKNNIEIFKVEKVNIRKWEGLLSSLNINLLLIFSASILKDCIFF